MSELSGPTLQVDSNDPTPPYEQVRRQIAALVRRGILQPGDRLPSLRQLAGDLGLAVGTVARAYTELESAGVLVSRRGAGTRIAPDADRATGSPAEDSDPTPLDALARAYLRQAEEVGVSAAEAAAAVVRLAR